MGVALVAMVDGNSYLINNISVPSANSSRILTANNLTLAKNDGFLHTLMLIPPVSFIFFI